MITRRIAGATNYLGAPPGWTPEKDGKCGYLAVRVSGNPRQGDGWCESAWEPTPDELAMLNAGGSVILRVIGWQPPVALYVERVTEDDARELVEPAQVQPPKMDACIKCELAGPLVRFCQHRQCPMRGLA